MYTNSAIRACVLHKALIYKYDIEYALSNVNYARYIYYLGARYVCHCSLTKSKNDKSIY